MIACYDTETYPIHKQVKATNDTVPRMVCLSWADEDHPDGVLLDRTDGIDWWLSRLHDGALLIGANLAFDLLVMLRAVKDDRPEVYEDTFRRVFKAPKHDVQIAARLEDIARGGMFMRGGYTLGDLEKRYLPEGVRTTEKKGLNVWRLRYNELDGVPIADYPADAARYALEDAVNTYGVYEQVKGRKNGQGVGIRTHYDWLLSLMTAWGLLVDGPWVASLMDFYDEQREEQRQRLIQYGLFDGKTGKKSLKAIRELFTRAFISVDTTPPRTASGKFVSTDKKAMNELEDLGALTPEFVAYSKYNRADKFISTYLQPLLEAGSLPLCPRFNVIVDSGRTSSSGPNVQNFPSRKNAHDKAILAAMLEDGDEDMSDELRVMMGCITGPDIRGAFVPRPGHVFVAADYSAIEMAGVAQCARNITGELGTLALAINKGLDLHCYVGAQIADVSYDEFVARKEAGDKDTLALREVSKIGNYGGWGGAQPPAFRSFARQQGVHIDLSTSEMILNTMGRVWSEREPYFRFIESCRQPNGTYYVQQHGPDRRTSGWRLRVTKRGPQALNTLFQGIVADGALWALNLIMQEVYMDEESPLFESRVVLFVHDEFVLETPKDKAEAAGQRLSELMVKGMKRFLPDLNVEAEPSIMEDRWKK